MIEANEKEAGHYVRGRVAFPGKGRKDGGGGTNLSGFGDTGDEGAARVRGVLVLTDPETDEGYGITLWGTEEDAKAFDSSGNYREQVIKLGRLLVESPGRRVYEVSIQM